MKAVMLDLETGNLQSIREAFRRIGCCVETASSPKDLAAAGLVILPGVGSFARGMATLEKNGMVEPLRAHARAGRALLGICLGMQLLAETGDEDGPTPGLGLISGRVPRLTPRPPEYRVPNMGWCDVRFRDPDRFVPPGADRIFYFAHSYHLLCDDPNEIVGVIDFGGDEIAVAVEREGVVGLQFHPEKSQDAGLDLLRTLLGRLA